MIGFKIKKKNPSLLSEITLLRDNLSHSLSYLKSHYLKSIGKRVSLDSSPLYLVMGPKGCGKTTFLSHAELNFVGTWRLIQKFNSDMPTHYCNWWLANDAIFIEIPGHFLVEHEEAGAYLWHTFAQWLKKHRKRPLDGLLCVMDIHALGSHKEAMAQVFKIKDRLIELHIKSPIPTYLALTKTDRLSGFNEFFQDLGPLERQEYWGLMLNENHAISPTEDFYQAFDQALKRLHARLIWRLHHERNVEVRGLIKDFPGQIESLKEILASVVFQLSDNFSAKKQFPLQGVYFSSGIQQGDALNVLMKSSLNWLNIKLPHDVSKSVVQKPYFIHQFFQKIILNARGSPAIPVSNPASKIFYSLAFLPPLIAILFGIQYYQKQKQTLDLSIQTYFSSHPSHAPTSLNDTLNSLNQQSNVQHYFAHPKISSWVLGSDKIHQTLLIKSKQDALNIIQTQLIPQLLSRLEQRLLGLDKNHPDQIYRLLKAYLMIGNPTYYNPQAIHTWILGSATTDLGITHTQDAALEQYIDLKMRTHPQAYPLNEAVMTHAREILNEIPYPLLAYLMVKSEVDTTPMSLFTDQFGLGFHLDAKLQASKLYTGDYFYPLYMQVIPAVSQELGKGNWVLGPKAQSDLTPDDVAELTQEVRGFYLNDYMTQWRQFLSGIKLNNINNFHDLEVILTTMTGNQSALTQIVEQYANNTSLTHLTQGKMPPDDVKIVMQALAQENFEPINQIQPALLQTLDRVLTNLKNDIAKINVSPNPNETLMSILSGYMDHPYDNPYTQLHALSGQLPEPLRSFVSTIETQSLNLFMTEGHRYLSSVWQSTVLPIYTNNLNQRYPLFKNTPFEAKPEDFQKFFSPQGLLAVFFNRYLKAFIETGKPKWEWKSLDGVQFPLSANTLEQFERASIVSRMFFADGNSQLISRFFLQPLSFMPGVVSITIRNNGQEVIDEVNQHHLSGWMMGENIDNQITVSLASTQSQVETISKVGSWAWLHLLEQAHLQPTTDPKRFELTLDSNGLSAKYELLANNMINPFIPGVVDHFRCPENL